MSLVIAFFVGVVVGVFLTIAYSIGIGQKLMRRPR